MRFSIITPVHKTDLNILRQTAASILAQTYTDYEWVIAPNNAADTPEFYQALYNEFPMASIAKSGMMPSTNSIGAIKAAAFALGVGDYLVELDWDDVLTPDALAEMSVCISEHQPDFIYSNDSYFTGDFQKAGRFNPAYGWKWRDFEYNGHVLDENIAFDFRDPASALWIYFAPDHVRCWNREFYNRIGGHNPNIAIGDDHELMLRTWLNTSEEKLFHIDKCLYLYRAENNTWLSERNAEIQQQVQVNYQNYVMPVALEWAKRRNLLALDLCASINPTPGFQSVDIASPANYIMDLNDTWKFPDNSVGIIRAADALEHLRDKQHVMSEIHRVLAPGGFLLSYTPSALGQGAFQDPTHVSYWVKNSFYYYTKSQYAQYIRNIDKRFMTHRLFESFPNDYCKHENILYVTFEAQCIKNDYTPPGLIEI